MKKLELESMEKIQGGVPREEYCQTLIMIMMYNDRTAPMYAAWGTNCSPYGFRLY